jgi:hypothetical protein
MSVWRVRVVIIGVNEFQDFKKRETGSAMA